jgi:hypothetical protein
MAWFWLPAGAPPGVAGRYGSGSCPRAASRRLTQAQPSASWPQDPSWRRSEAVTVELTPLNLTDIKADTLDFPGHDEHPSWN